MVELLKEGMNPSEDMVRRLVFASEVPPSFDNSLVVPEDLKVTANARKPGD